MISGNTLFKFIKLLLKACALQKSESLFWSSNKSPLFRGLWAPHAPALLGERPALPLPWEISHLPDEMQSFCFSGTCTHKTPLKAGMKTLWWEFQLQWPWGNVLSYSDSPCWEGLTFWHKAALDDQAIFQPGLCFACKQLFSWKALTAKTGFKGWKPSTEIQTLTLLD